MSTDADATHPRCTLSSHTARRPHGPALLPLRSRRQHTILSRTPISLVNAISMTYITLKRSQSNARLPDD